MIWNIHCPSSLIVSFEFAHISTNLVRRLILFLTSHYKLVNMLDGDYMQWVVLLIDQFHSSWCVCTKYVRMRKFLSLQFRCRCEGEVLYPTRPMYAKIYSKFDAFRLADKYADVTIKCGNRLFKCHRIILARASYYFDTAFFDNASEEGSPRTK